MFEEISEDCRRLRSVINSLVRIKKIELESTYHLHWLWIVLGIAICTGYEEHKKPKTVTTEIRGESDVYNINWTGLNRWICENGVLMHSLEPVSSEAFLIRATSEEKESERRKLGNLEESRCEKKKKVKRENKTRYVQTYILKSQWEPGPSTVECDPVWFILLRNDFKHSKPLRPVESDSHASSKRADSETWNSFFLYHT